MSYKVIKEIGRGGTATVYLVRATTGKKARYAIKEVSLTGMSRAVKDACLGEIEIMKQLKHDNILRVYESTLVGDTLKIRMEYASKGSLFDFIYEQHKRFLPENTIIDVFTQICLAVKYIHDRKVLHRDIKPENILVCANGIVKLGDFGFARRLESTAAKAITRAGTPMFTSPEMLMGLRYSMPSDIWSLGCVLYELCARRAPFDGANVDEISKNVRTRRPPRLPSIYSEDLRQLVSDMLTKNPRNRPSIHEILSRPILKYKVMALLGADLGNLELAHTVFHGQPSGETPAELKGELETIKLQIERDSTFVFMGRPMKVPGQTPLEKANYVQDFIAGLVPDMEISELRQMKREEMSSIEEQAVTLAIQLEKYKEVHQLK